MLTTASVTGSLSLRAVAGAALYLVQPVKVQVLTN